MISQSKCLCVFTIYENFDNLKFICDTNIKSANELKMVHLQNVRCKIYQLYDKIEISFLDDVQFNSYKSYKDFGVSIMFDENTIFNMKAPFYFRWNQYKNKTYSSFCKKHKYYKYNLVSFEIKKTNKRTITEFSSSTPMSSSYSPLCNKLFRILDKDEFYAN